MTRHTNAVKERGWETTMRGLFDGAQFKRAGELFDAELGKGQRPSPEAQLLRARVFLKGQQEVGVKYLLDNRPQKPTTEFHGEWLMFLGAGLSRMFDFERADTYFEKAEGLIKSKPLRASLAYWLARRFLLENRPDRAWSYLEKMDVDSTEQTRLQRRYLESMIFNKEERYEDEAACLIDLIADIGKARPKHFELWAHAVQNLALLAREIPKRDAIAVARAEVDVDIVWPDDFKHQHFQALKAVGWALALQGDLLSCFRYLRKAERTSPNEAFDAILHIDRAHFARIMRESNWAQDELAMAESIAETVDWEGKDREERFGLLLLAQAFAEIDLEKARYYLTRYKNLERNPSPLHRLVNSPRMEAYVSFIEGSVLEAAGKSQAEELLRKSWVTFDRSGYAWRAGLAALHLYRVTKKDRWLLLAEDQLEPYATSWLGVELRDATRAEKPEKRSLPPMQRKVFDLLCSQHSTKEIAETLDLSQHTVRNHLKAVFKTYGVNNRAALVAEAARRGELGALSAPAEVAAKPKRSKH